MVAAGYGCIWTFKARPWGVTGPQALEIRHDLSCAAPAHTEELLDRRAVEVSGCHGTQVREDFVKSMKPGGLGGHGGTPALLHVRERSGIMALPGSGGEGGLITHDKGYYHSYISRSSWPIPHRRAA